MLVDLLDEGDRFFDEGGALWRDLGEFRALVLRGGAAGDESFFLEGAEHLGGHGDVGFAVAGELNLGEVGTGLGKPAEACEEDKLGMGKVQGGKGSFDQAAPTGAHLPEEKSRAFFRAFEGGDFVPGDIFHRFSACAIIEAISCGRFRFIVRPMRKAKSQDNMPLISMRWVTWVLP